MDLQTPITLTLKTLEGAIYVRALLNQAPTSTNTIEYVIDDAYPGGSHAAFNATPRRDNELWHEITDALAAQGLPTDTAGLKQHICPSAPTDLNGYKVAYHPTEIT